MPRHRWLSAALLPLVLAMLPAGAATSSARPLDAPVADARDAAPPVDNRSPAQERAMLDAIRRNVDALRRAGVLAPVVGAQAVTFGLPLRLAPGVPGDAGYFVSALADHDPAAGAVLDYHGGNRTYDGHRGIDFALWPFPWNKLDAGDVQVVAAAAGTIVAKADVNPADHHCGQGSGGDWNYVALSHADGRMTIYGHMRYRSLTAKAIGATVAQGEMLGTAASSGDSSGPHVHFEVRAANFSPIWIDPFAGPHSQAESLWADQPPYVDAAMNLLGTHAGPPSAPDPCQPADMRLQDRFRAPAAVYIYAYYRDYQGALPTEVRVLRPDGTLFRSWTHTDETEFSRATSRAWTAQLAAGDPAGTWRVEATYNGRVHQTSFTLEAPEPPAMTLIARDDEAQTVGAAPVTIPVLANDAAADGDPLTLAAVDPPANGAATIVGADVRYTARPGFVGTDAFTYTVRTAREQAKANVRVLVVGEVRRVWLPLLRR